MNASKRLLWILPFSLLMIFVQSTLLKAVLPSFLVPNFLICSVIFLSFYFPTPLGAALAFSVGFLIDLYGGLMLGPWAGAYVLVFLACALFSQRLFVESRLASSVVVFGATICANLIYAVLIAQLRTVSWASAVPVAAEAFTSALIAGPTLSVLKRICIRRDRGLGLRRTALV